MNSLKLCHRCKQLLDISSFGKNKNNPDGLSYYCRQCSRQRVNEYRLKNPDLIKAAKKRYYEKNKLRILASQAAYRKNNPKQIITQRLAYYQKNKNKVNSDNKRWRENNPQKVNQYSAARRARKKSAITFLIAKKDWKKLLSSNCFYCGSNENMQIDHVVPLARGGTHGIGNLVACCRTCNTSKQDLLLVEWKRRS